MTCEPVSLCLLGNLLLRNFAAHILAYSAREQTSQVSLEDGSLLASKRQLRVFHQLLGSTVIQEMQTEIWEEPLESFECLCWRLELSKVVAETTSQAKVYHQLFHRVSLAVAILSL